MKKNGEDHLVHLHIFNRESDHVLRHLAFRDFLKTHPDIADFYGNIKLELAAAYPDDIDSYIEGKNAAVKKIEIEALNGGMRKADSANEDVANLKNRKKLYVSVISVIVLVLIAAVYFAVHQKNAGNGPEFADIHTVLPQKQMPLNVVGIGDSLTKGVGDLDEHGYAGLTSEKLKTLSSVSSVHFTDYGVRGDTTKDLLEVLKEKKVKNSISHSDFIFMTIGGNDLVDVLKKTSLI